MTTFDKEIEGAMAEVIPFDSPARHSDMTPDRERHLAALQTSMRELLDRKYRKGQVANGGNLWEKPGLLRHALDEVIDQGSYLLSMEGQLSALALGLRSGAITSEQAADALERLLQ